MARSYGDDADVLAAIDAGAIGYLLKDAPREELLRGVRAAAEGQSVLSPAVAATLLGRVRAPEPEMPLSPRELEVLQLVATGRSNRGRRRAVQLRGDRQDAPAATSTRSSASTTARRPSRPHMSVDCLEALNRYRVGSQR